MLFPNWLLTKVKDLSTYFFMKTFMRKRANFQNIPKRGIKLPKSEPKDMYTESKLSKIFQKFWSLQIALQNKKLKHFDKILELHFS